MTKSERYLKDYSDEELIVLTEERNTLAFKILYERYKSPLYNFIRRYTNNRELSEDLLQESFTRVWFSACQFNSRRGTFKAWLFTIAINVTRNEMARKSYNYRYEGVGELVSDGEEFPDNGESGALLALEKAELKDAVNSALGNLNPLMREVLLLKHFHGLKFREIAEMTNTPVGTLKARFHCAIMYLRKNLKLKE